MCAGGLVGEWARSGPTRQSAGPLAPWPPGPLIRRPARFLPLVFLLAGILSCREPSGLLRVVAQTEPGGVHLTLLAAPGAKINARLKPALERPDGSVLRFDSPAVTPDSSYFIDPPELLLAGPARGIVRASVCAAGATVCRMVAVRYR
jgi:hypothetical protein